MSRFDPDNEERLTTRTIHIGGVVASRAPIRIRTVLGSCIAVCLRDPFTGVGGMNHFILPFRYDEDSEQARYGVHAMELLINACMTEGAERGRLVAKVFGGGHVLQMREADDNVPISNIRFTLNFLEAENIPIAARDVGGYEAREVIFLTHTGRTLLKRLRSSQMLSSRLQEKERQEQEQLREALKQPLLDDSNITLF